MKPKFKKRDIVKHILTEEKFLILKPIENDLIHDDCSHGNSYSECSSSNYGFKGRYLIMKSDYKRDYFPEWQLQEIKNE